MLRNKKARLKAGLLSVLLVTTFFIAAATPMVSADNANDQNAPGFSYFASSKLKGQILDHQLYYFLLACFSTSGDSRVTDDEVKSGAWLKGDDLREVRGGMYDNPSPYCGESRFFKEAIDRMFGSDTDMVNLFCSLPFTAAADFGGLGDGNNSGDSGQEACISGILDGQDGELSGSRTERREAMKAKLASTTAGVRANNPLGDAEYIRSYETLMNGCNVTLVSKIDSGASVADDRVKVPVVAQDGSVTWFSGTYDTSWIYTSSGIDPSNSGWQQEKIPLVAKSDGGSQAKTCKELAAALPFSAEGYSNYLKGPGKDDAEATDGSITVGSGKDSGIDTDCGGVTSVLSNPLKWIACPMLKGFSEAAQVLDNGIMDMLCVDEGQIFGANSSCDSAAQGDGSTSDAYKTAWNVFRIIALGLLAIAGLVVIISQTLGLEILDAYTIKKLLPRILIAAIGITLSWELMQFFITFTNMLGLGIRNLIYAPFQAADLDTAVLSGGTSAVITLTTLGGLAVLGPLGILSLVATALLAVLIGFLVLVLRNLIIILLVIMVPIAIVAYILPNTQRIWHLWWDSFSKALMMFPLIAALIAAGHVFAAIATKQATVQNGINGTISSVAGFIAYFAPYFLIPLTLRFAGGLLATLGGFTNNRSRGMFDRLKKFRQGQSEKRLGYYGQHAGDWTMQKRAEAVRRLNASASSSGRFSGAMKRRVGRQIAGLGGIESHMSAINARTSKQINDQIATGSDADIRGLTVDRSMGWEAARSRGLARTTDDGTRQWKSLGGAWISEADVLEGQRKWGHDTAAQQAALSYEMRKASSEREVQGITERFGSLAQNQWGMTNTQAGGAWIGAAFENQNQHLEFKSTNWRNGQLNDFQGTGLLGKGFVDEVYEKRGSYNMSQMGSNTFEQLKEAHRSADRVLADAGSSQEARAFAQDQKEKIAAIAETFVHEAGYGGGTTMVPGGEGEQPTPVVSEPTSRRQTSTQGSAHTAERVRELAELVGVGPSGSAPSGSYSYPIERGSTPNSREQK